MRKIISYDYRGKKWERVLINNIFISKDEYRISYITKNPYGHKYQSGENFGIGIKAINGEEFDYSQNFSMRDYPQVLICTVIGAINQKYYDWIIIELIKGGGCGENDASISFDKEKNKTYFEFTFCLKEGDPYTEISYTDSVKLFHAYFNAYKKFVEECAPEIKEAKQQVFEGRDKQGRDKQGRVIWKHEKWYPRFLKALEKLNKYYEEMVGKGEIEE